MLIKFLKLIAYCVVLATFISCNQTNGTYVVYKIQPSEQSDYQPVGYSDSLYNVMKSALMGTKYEVVFNDKFVNFKSLQRNTEALLPKQENKDSGEIYSSDQMEGITKVTTTLKVTKDNDLLCIVKLERPLLDGETPDNEGIIVFDKKRAQVVCHLSKVK